MMANSGAARITQINPSMCTKNVPTTNSRLTNAPIQK